MHACFASHGSMQALWSEFFWLPSCSRQSFILSLLLFPSPTRSVGLSEVARTVRSELGAEISELFREFDQKAIAAASLAQVSTVVVQYSGAKLSSARPGKERYKSDACVCTKYLLTPPHLHKVQTRCVYGKLALSQLFCFPPSTFAAPLLAGKGVDEERHSSRPTANASSFSLPRRKSDTSSERDHTQKTINVSRQARRSLVHACLVLSCFLSLF